MCVTVKLMYMTLVTFFFFQGHDLYGNRQGQEDKYLEEGGRAEAVRQELARSGPGQGVRAVQGGRDQQVRRRRSFCSLEARERLRA